MPPSRETVPGGSLREPPGTWPDRHRCQRHAPFSRSLSLMATSSQLEPVAKADELAPQSNTAVTKSEPREIFVNPFTGEVIIFDGCSDADIIDTIKAMMDRYDEIKALFEQMKNQGKGILASRMRARGAKGIPHPNVVVELKTEYSDYIFIPDELAKARPFLKPDEAAKVVHWVPEQIIPEQRIPGHWEEGAARSITALINRYPGSDAAKHLEAGMTRSALGEEVIFKPIKEKPLPVKKP